MQNACVIGYGTVGKATAHSLGITKYYSRTTSNITLEEASQCKFIFICLPTPTIDGKCFTDDIVATIRLIKDYGKENIYIIRSTVYPGFNRFLQKTFGIDRFVSNPEFLSEDTALKDAKNPDLIVIGSDSERYRRLVKGLYTSIFRYPTFIETDSVTAELIKYSLNTFFTTKVIFANEIYDYAQKVHANYETIRKVLQSHRWGSKNHFKVFYKEKRGVHGKCLPKDTQALAMLTDSPFFQMLIERNKRFINE